MVSEQEQNGEESRGEITVRADGAVWRELVEQAEIDNNQQGQAPVEVVMEEDEVEWLVRATVAPLQSHSVTQLQNDQID
jgi:hypothetical protein